MKIFFYLFLFTTITVNAGGGEDGFLPVELVYFEAEVSADTVKLRWGTATEVDNFGFDIERASENGEFEKVGFELGHGNSNSPKHYSFDDTPGESGLYYYRLKQIDTDGDYSFSDTVKADIVTSVNEPEEIKPQTFELHNYPNPFNGYTVIRYHLPEAGEVSLVLYNATGEKVKDIYSGYSERGAHDLQLDAGKLASGVYLCRLKTAKGLVTTKIILMK